MKRLAILFAVVLVAAACGSDTPTANEDAGAADTTVATTVATTTTMAEEHHDDEAAEEHHDDEAAEEHHDDKAAEERHDDAAAEEHHDEEGAEGDDHATDAADRTVEVVMNEFSFVPAVMTVAAGETVEFVVHNEGVIEHEFRLTTEHAALEHIESGHEGHDEDGGHGHDEEILLLGPGETGTITVTFDEHADFDVVACLLPDHYEAGMHIPLSIAG